MNEDRVQQQTTAMLEQEIHNLATIAHTLQTLRVRQLISTMEEEDIRNLKDITHTLQALTLAGNPQNKGEPPSLSKGYIDHITTLSTSTENSCEQLCCEYNFFDEYTYRFTPVIFTPYLSAAA
jgi:hypothetical protein